MIKKVLLTVCFLFAAASPAFAATKYARTVGGNWSTDATWSTSSGGAADTTKCVAADACFLDANSGNVTVDVASAAGSLDCTAYTGTLTQGANLTVSGNITLVSGMTFTPSTYTVIMDATGTLTSGTKEFNGLDFQGAGASTITLGDNVTVNGSLSVGSTGGINTFNGNTIYAKGNVDRDHANDYNNTGTTVIELSGTGNQSIDIKGTVANNMRNPFRINKTGGTATFTGTTAQWFVGGFTYDAGTCDFTTNSSEIVFGGGTQNINTSGLTFHKLSFGYGANTVTLTANITVANISNLDNTVGVQTINGGTIYAQGDVNHTASGYNTLGTATIEISGGANQSISLQGAAANHVKLNIIINKSGNTATFANVTHLWSTGTMTYTAGTVNPGTSTLSIEGNCTLNTNGMSWNNFTHNATAITVSSALDVNGNFQINAGKTFLPGANTVYIGGNFTNLGGFTAATSTVVFDGDASHTIDGTTTFNNLTCDASDTCLFDDADVFTISGVMAGDGSWRTDDGNNTVDVDCNGSETITSGQCVSVDSATGSIAIDTTGTLTDCVNWTTTSTRKLVIVT